MKKLIILAMLFLGWTTRTVAQDIPEAVGDSIAVPAADSLAVSPADSLAAAEPEEEISVTKFSCLTNDLTARVIAPKRDQNNEVCAVIKIVTKDKSLFFEPDALGITAREDQPGEIWLYVPHGAKRITIKHERFGIIRNYFYPEPINEAMVYEMVLFVPEEKLTIPCARHETVPTPRFSSWVSTSTASAVSITPRRPVPLRLCPNTPRCSTCSCLPPTA